MATEADWKGWKPADFAPYLEVVFGAFGTKRIMFGSDWPVCTVAATYPRVFDVVSDYMERLPAEEQADVWGDTALKFYGLA
jgi:L-fuconolactonase